MYPCAQLRGYNLLPFHFDKQTLMLQSMRHIFLCAPAPPLPFSHNHCPSILTRACLPEKLEMTTTCLFLRYSVLLDLIRRSCLPET